ncbi:MAG TPA: hypothetical protein VJQ85_08115 [Gaiellaceae bacterium]|nr:hypothetical protein [Gaiellaceae bacterium]
MRSLLVTAVVALAVGGGALAAGWSVEASALPSPPSADRMAVDALVVLEHRRFVASTLRIDGGPALRATCVRGWFPKHGTLLSVSDGASLFFRAVRPKETSLERAELVLAGCPRVLSPAIAELLQSGVRTHETRTWFGRPATALRIASITLYVTPKHSVPLGVAIHRPWFSGVSRLSFAV